MTQPDGGAPALEVSDVVAGYGGGDVLQGVSLAVADGGITCVVGPNGAGKSTLLATISGLPRPAKFNSVGENVVAQKVIFQWQNGGKYVRVLPTNATGSVPIIDPSPAGPADRAS
jgi:ABC-type branched-subunit amino acid transport system ATPase component